MKQLIVAGGLLFGLVGTSANAADDAARSEPTKSCREEVWRVYAPSNGGPKAAWMPRSEKRTVVICDKQVFAKIQERIANGSSDPEKQ